MKTRYLCAHFAFVFALLIFVCPLEFDRAILLAEEVESNDIVRVEEDWELVVKTPDLNSAGSSGTSAQLGVDFYAYPLARTFTIGFQGIW